MALTMANMKNRKNAFAMNQMMPGIHVNGAIGNGGSQPPRNRIVPIAHMVRIAMYSPRKKSRNGVEEYSTANPATSSDSASTRSNGGRLVSARAEMKNIPNIGRSGSQNQLNRPQLPSCALTIADKFSEPTHNRTVMKTKPIETS